MKTKKVNNDAKIQKIPKFLFKLYNIVQVLINRSLKQNPSYDKIIKWSGEGDFFTIVDLPEFCDTILPKYYRHNNYASFVRQVKLIYF